MTTQVTLTLSEATLQRAQRLARQRRTTVEDVLTDWLEHGDSTDDITPLPTGQAYHIDTPIDSETAAEELLKFLNIEKQRNQSKDSNR